MTEHSVRDESIEAAVLERCRRIDTSTWSDALDGLGIAGVMDGIVRRGGTGTVVGPAVTIREEVGRLGSFRFADFDVGGIISSTGAGCIAVVGMDGAEVSTFGGLSTSAALASGMAGIVIDGGCRDVEEIRSSGLFVASRHVTPRSGKLRVKVVEVGGIVRCGGVTVAPGDLVIADDTGIVVVPAARVLEALPRAEQLSGNDQTFARELQGGAEFGAVAARMGHV